jgi:hypothetical protein
MPGIQKEQRNESFILAAEDQQDHPLPSGMHHDNPTISVHLHFTVPQDRIEELLPILRDPMIMGRLGHGVVSEHEDFVVAV